MANEPERRELPESRSDNGTWRRYALGIAGILLAILILQNLQEVEVRFITINTEVPLIFALLIVGALGTVVGWAVPRIRRGGRD